MHANDHDSYVASARRTIRMECDAVSALEQRIDGAFVKACDLLLDIRGRVIVTGMGKSGHIASKIAATLASTGTPAFYVHPAEASHGDIGMITADDAVIALSNSGRSPEVVTLLPLLKRLGIPLVSMTGDPRSPLAEAADAHLDTGVSIEACPLNLAPTSSTTTALVMGDALAIALLEARGFTAEDFAFSHPGGTLGKKLLLKVEDVMHTGAAIPRVQADTVLAAALLEISRKGLGMTTVTDADDQLLGIFTDGDLRRALDEDVDVRSTRINALMTRDAKTIAPNMLAAEALRIMEENKITSLVVKDGSHMVGVLHLMSLLHAGIA
ncbi:MAG: KpsF/GutQ family sugar-phosphate isomerase [Haliea sp.]|uniref:KpsF/GutQ family sugar-phosphate isomerase n=1 Tax=Haliea sp. TaxID=1932666 RepID=UPI0032EB8B86